MLLLLLLQGFCCLAPHPVLSQLLCNKLLVLLH
jgi:hypothetical protein